MLRRNLRAEWVAFVEVRAVSTLLLSGDAPSDAMRF